jgi:hypothetical protein
MYTSLRALVEPAGIKSMAYVTYLFLTALAFGYLSFVVLISSF